MAGMTPEGLEIKRLPDIITDLRERAEVVFGDLVDPADIVDTSDSSLLGRIIGLYSGEVASLWEAIQEAVWAYDPETATGKALDAVTSLGGVTRRGSSPTRADIYIEGNRGGQITRGMNVRSSVSGELYGVTTPITLTPSNCIGIGVTLQQPTTDGEYIITYKLSHSAVDEQIKAPMLSTDTPEIGLEKIQQQIQSNHPLLDSYFKDGILLIRSRIEFQQSSFSVDTPLDISKVIGVTVVEGLQVDNPVPETAGVLNRIATPSLAWDAVWNPFPASTGSVLETDDELRVRFRDTKFQRATNIIESLYTSLYGLDGVEEVSIIENDTSEVDEYGNPPHSFLVIVEGGLNSQIALEIWRNRPSGIQSNGDISVSILDSFGFYREVKFSRPLYPQVYIRLDITKEPDFPVDGEDQIKEALVSYILSHKIGEEIKYSRLYTPINGVPGHQVNSLEIGWSLDNMNSSNLEVAYNEKPVILKDNIEFI